MMMIAVAPLYQIKGYKNLQPILRILGAGIFGTTMTKAFLIETQQNAQNEGLKAVSIKVEQKTHLSSIKKAASKAFASNAKVADKNNKNNKQQIMKKMVHACNPTCPLWKCPKTKIETLAQRTKIPAEQKPSFSCFNYFQKFRNC